MIRNIYLFETAILQAFKVVKIQTGIHWASCNRVDGYRC